MRQRPVWRDCVRHQEVGPELPIEAVVLVSVLGGEKVEATTIDVQIGHGVRFACLLFLNRVRRMDVAVALAGAAQRREQPTRLSRASG
jgi:hypothetical protein